MVRPPNIGPEWLIITGRFNMRCKEKIDELVHSRTKVLIRELKFVIRDGHGERTIDGADVVQYDKSYLYIAEEI